MLLLRSLLLEAVVGIEQALLVVCREAVQRLQRVLTGAANIILSLSSGEDTAAADRKRFMMGNTMSARSSRGLKRIESSFNRTIAEGYLNQPGQVAGDVSVDNGNSGGADGERAQAEKRSGSSGERRNGGAMGVVVDAGRRTDESERQSTYVDEWAWEWDRDVDPRDSGRLIRTAEYIYYNTAILPVLIRIVVAAFLYVYASTVALLSSVNVFLTFLTHYHRDRAVPGADVGLGAATDVGDEAVATDERERIGTVGTGLHDDGGGSLFAVPVEAASQQQRLGVIEEVTDYLELQFTRVSSWIKGSAARVDGLIEDGASRGGGLRGAAGTEDASTANAVAPSPSTSTSTATAAASKPLLGRGARGGREMIIDGDDVVGGSPLKGGDAAVASTSYYDERTVADMIREAGYPCEVHQIRTPDGYHLQMFRIPRKASMKGSVLFIHGVYDSAMAFVSGGLCSQPYAAYDLGFDVWLGNLRICSPWKREGGNFAAAYWNFSINELAIYDCRSFVEHIQGTRDAEIVAHSLGGSVALLYMIWRQRRLRLAGYAEKHATNAAARNRQHHRGVRRPSLPPDGVCRLILLSPAGFHHFKPPIAVFLFVIIDSLFGVVFRRLNFGLYLPTRIGRLLLHKLMQDVVNMPSLMSLVNLVVGKLSLSDSSDFAAALHLPHLSPDAMVGCSYKLCLSLYECYLQGRFVSFHNNGNKEKNFSQFFAPGAIDVAEDYHLIDVPVHITAGTRDGVIRVENILCHYDAMRSAGVAVTYKEFDVGHLEFRSNESRDLRKYVLELLQGISS